MPYDHHRKAGNEGDCVKHPALIGALDTVSQSAKTLFHYLDVFSGHAWHPLLDGKEYEWRNGIGKLASANLPGDVPASVRCWWGMWHEASQWPASTPPGYPGSSWIAAHRCREVKRPVKLELYDQSEEVRRDLERAFPSSHAIQDNSPNICLIGQSLDPIKEKQDHIQQADFVFIDPPGWQTTAHPEYPKWKDVLDHVLKPRAEKKRPVLMWMPSAGNFRVFSGEPPNGEVGESAALGYQWSAVRWRTYGPGTACILVYNCAEKAIQEAAKCIVRIAGNGWEYRDSSAYTAESPNTVNSHLRNH